MSNTPGVIRAARAVINSELPALRHRIADGYAVVKWDRLERLRFECIAAGLPKKAKR